MKAMDTFAAAVLQIFRKKTPTHRLISSTGNASLQGLFLCHIERTLGNKGILGISSRKVIAM